MKQRKVYKNPRLPVMPLAVLLPPLGELAELRRLSDTLQRRLEAVQDARRSRDDEDSELRARLGNEESMLNQVLQWLSIGEVDE